MEITDDQIEDCARLCHTANREWCAINGDYSQPEWEAAPLWQKQSARKGVRFHLDNPTATAGASHRNWMRQKEADGWVYGEIKDEQAKTHPCMVPFAKLPAVQQIKDRLFMSIVHAVFHQHYKLSFFRSNQER